MPKPTIILIVVAVLALAGYGLHRFAISAERRGWIYYRKETRDQAARVGVMTVMSVFHPSVEHVFEQTISDRAHIEQSKEGSDDPPIDELPATGLRLFRSRG
jgi:hypothetical protein